MATKPAHVKVALREGAQAGLDAYIESIERVTNGGTEGLPPVQEALAEIRKIGGYKKRTGEFSKPEKALKFYCNKYGLDPDALPTKAKRTNKATTGSVAGNASTTRKARNTSGTTKKVALDTDDNVAKLRALLDAGFSVDDALEIVNRSAASATESDEDDDTEDTTPSPSQYAPSVNIADDPATNGRLWKLNSLGLLRIVDFDDAGDPITNMEAHEVIAVALS